MIFEAGAVAPAFVLAGEGLGTPVPGFGLQAPQRANSVPLAIEQPVAPVFIEGELGAVIPGLGAEIRPDFADYIPPSKATEVPSLRSEFGRVTANPDGTLTAEYFMSRLNFMDSAGTFQPIDLTLVRDDSVLGLHTAANSFELRVNGNGVGSAFTVQGVSRGSATGHGWSRSASCCRGSGDRQRVLHLDPLRGGWVTTLRSDR